MDVSPDFSRSRRRAALDRGAVALTMCLLLSCSGSADSSADLSPGPAFQLGINLNTIAWYDGSRPLANLIYGSGWQIQNTRPWGGGEEIPDAFLDPNGWVKTVPPGYRVTRGLSVPAAGGDVVCRFDGKGILEAEGPVSQVSKAPGVTRFRLRATYPDPQPVNLSYFVAAKDYIRNIDCREADLPSDAVLAPELLNAAAGFKVIRFVKWQPATEANRPVTWATRNKPGDGDYAGKDGVPIEVMVRLANKLQADPWFTIPWNADTDYIRNFATYVRSSLAPGHKAYVEVSNEVWNDGYPVYRQACDEAMSENLKGANGGHGCAGERYAEKTRQVMSIWSDVFAGDEKRLVRVFAWQHVSPYESDKLLGYHDTYKSVDALATAPYFGHDLSENMSFNQVMAALPAKVSETLAFADQQKAVAAKRGLRYLTYEGGQHLIFPNNVPLLERVERDERMYGIYNQFLSGWKGRIGDTLTLFVLTGGVTKWGAFGMIDYAGQPSTRSPKMRAADKFLSVPVARGGCQAEC